MGRFVKIGFRDCRFGIPQFELSDKLAQRFGFLAELFRCFG